MCQDCCIYIFRYHKSVLKVFNFRDGISAFSFSKNWDIHPNFLYLWLFERLTNGWKRLTKTYTAFVSALSFSNILISSWYIRGVPCRIFTTGDLCAILGLYIYIYIYKSKCTIRVTAFFCIFMVTNLYLLFVH